MRKLVVLLLFFGIGWECGSAFQSHALLPLAPAVKPKWSHLQPPRSSFVLKSKKNQDKEEDDNKDLEELLENVDQIGDVMLLNFVAKVDATPTSDNTPKLGIDIGSQLQPLTDAQAADLKAAAREVINDGIAEGIDEIAKLRTAMNAAIAKQRRQNALRSDRQLQQESEKLLKKIDRMTESFLDETRSVRDETKLVARADASLAGRGTELGVWGVLEGAAVVTTTKGVLLGSVEAAVANVERQEKLSRAAEMSDLKSSFEEDVEVPQVNSNRVVIVADTKQVRTVNFLLSNAYYF